MKQKIHFLFMLLLMLLTGVGGVKAETTYKLEKVTEVEAGGLYVFEQSGHVMDNSISSNALQTTTNFKTAGLSGAESYVWTLESATGGFYMKNVSLSKNPFLNNAKEKTNLSFGSKSSIWSFTLQNGETFLINNPGNGNRLLAYPNEETYIYKAYAESNASTSPHAIVVYKLVEETGDEPVVVATPTFSPEAGEVSQGTEVTISTATEGATIYYTIDGSTPTENSTKGSSVVINEPTTLKAIAVKEGCENSEVAEATYTIKQTIAGYAIDFENSLDAYVDWTMTNIEQKTADIPAHGGTYYGTTGGKATASIQTTEKIAHPGLFTCYISKTSSNTTSSTWYVQVSSDGENWTDVTTASATSMSKGSWNEVTANLDGYSDVYVRLYYNGSTAVRAVDDISLKMSSSVKVPVISLTPDTYFEAKVVTITCETEGAKIYYTLDGSDPTSESTPYTDPITISETTTLKAIAIKGEDASAVATAVYKIVVTKGKGTVENPFTVADARNILSEGLTPPDVYVTGIVSGIVEAYNSQYGNISYNISDDGTTEAAQLQAYRGKGKNGADFTSDADIQVKDVVVLKGNLIDYKGTYELAAGNQLVSLVRPEKAEPNLTYANAAVSAVRGEAFTAPVLTNPNNLTVVYSSSDKTVATVDSESGEVTLLKAGETTITASFAGNADYKEGSASYKLTVTVPSHTATFFVNGQQQGEPATVAEDEAITFPIVAEELYGKKFVGWTTEAIDYAGDKPATLVNAATMGNTDVTYYAVFANVTAGTATNTVDELTQTTTDVTGTSYVEWSGKTAASSAVYAGQSAGGDKNSGDCVQLRSNNSNSGVITTTSGGKATKVVVTWNSATAEGRTLNVYGKATAYEAATDLYDSENQGTLLGTIVKGTSTELAVDGDYAYVGLRSASGAMYLNSISITWENGTPDTYSDYCTTVVAPVKPAKPIIFHDDGGEYEGELTVAIAGEGTIKYTLNGGAEQTYTGPVTIDATTTVKAWTEKDGAKSDVVEKTFTIVEKAKGAVVEDGYYTIQTNEEKYVNVAGRKTVTLVSDNEGKAGTVIRVKADAEGVKVLRSQGVDVPGYAKKAMNYVPEIVQLAVDKLHAEGSGAILGEHGLDAIMEEFNKSFDYNLYLEKSGDAYRIYGRTPSMKPVVDFYAKNKANVDAKLPQLEAFINSAIDKVLEKTGGRGQSILVDFDLHNVWQNMDGTLTEPVDEASTLKFYEEVLTSETNVWNFAYQTAMIYWGNLKNHPRFPEIKDKLGDYAKYIDKVENIRPNFRYYIVPSASGVDFISQGNEAIINNNASAAWTMEPVTTFQIEVPNEKTVTVYPTSGGTQRTYKEYYTTLYTDFAYTLPEGVKAYKVTEITEKYGVAKREEITGVIPAQTPVLLVKSNEGAQTTLTLTTEAGTAVTGNLLVGADALINEYKIQTPQVVSLFDFAKEILGESAYETYVKKYEHLMLKNAGTVNNKYFFGLTTEDVEKCVKKNNKNENDCVIRSLSDGDQQIGFYNNWEAKANEAYLVITDHNPVKLFLIGDVNRDGAVSIADVTALVNIILGKAKYPEDNDKYDFEAANVNGDEIISIADVTALVNIILGK